YPPLHPPHLPPPPPPPLPPAAQRFPGVAAHLRACGPCSTDFEALVAKVRGFVDEGPVTS
ncbi:MAG: hypothetical protein ACR2FU_21155, partial [Streptosporangiaceae bacterium]